MPTISRASLAAGGSRRTDGIARPIQPGAINTSDQPCEQSENRMPTNASPVRWGILGTARIARKAATAIRLAEGAELTAIASRDARRAADWAAEHGAERSYGNYQALIDDPDIDAVYLPLPPALHGVWTAAAASAGKHVLSEKPLAVDTTMAREMIDVCRRHGVQLMEGTMWWYHPRTPMMQQLLRDGSLGRLRRVTAAFTSQWDSNLQKNLRMDRSLGGGCLRDLGWYCVGAAIWAFDDLPEAVWATGRYVNDVETNLSALLWFSNERVASFDCGFDVGLRKWLEVAGSDASIVCDDFTRPWMPESARFWVHNAAGQVACHQAPTAAQDVLMFEHFGRLIHSKTIEAKWAEGGLRVQHVIDALDRSARSGQPVDVPPLDLPKE